MKTMAIVLGLAVVLTADAPQSFTGVITDTMCGARHGMMKGTPDGQCVKMCAKGSSEYALYDGKQIWKLSDQKKAAQFPANSSRVYLGVIANVVAGRAQVIRSRRLHLKLHIDFHELAGGLRPDCNLMKLHPLAILADTKSRIRFNLTERKSPVKSPAGAVESDLAFQPTAVIEGSHPVRAGFIVVRDQPERL